LPVCPARQKKNPEKGLNIRFVIRFRPRAYKAHTAREFMQPSSRSRFFSTGCPSPKK
jgi:hypothetical protein